MMGKTHEIEMEISGRTAMWTRPDTGDCPVSYPAPTYSAAKGIFESMLWGPAVQIIPTKVEICAPVQYHNYQTNYGGPLRKSRVIAGGGGFQFLATGLIDVCYRLYAEVLPPGQLKNVYRIRHGNGMGKQHHQASGAVVMNDDTRKTVRVTYQERKQEEITHPFLDEKVMIGMLFHIQALLMARFLAR